MSDTGVMRRAGPAAVGARVTAALIVVVLACGAALVGLPVLMMMSVTGALSGDEGESFYDTSCLPTATVSGESITLDEEQRLNATTIIKTGVELGVPTRGLVVAVATALQESTLRNIPYGDRDSVGLFQQRNAWGSFDERTDPATSAELFYTGGRGGQPGLLDIRGWQQMAVTVAAQAVQVSAFPNAYAKWEGVATALVRSVVGDAPLGCTDAINAILPAGQVGEMLKVALAQQGKPYVWGATGPGAFDCSGLIVYSWRMAGYQLKLRTADQMYDVSTPVRPGEEKPGDLLFGAFSGSHAGEGNAGHVMIVVSPGTAVQAPRTGDVVKISKYTADGVNWRLGRLPASVFVPLAGNPPLAA